jgi:hypothetical protein
VPQHNQQPQVQPGHTPGPHTPAHTWRSGDPDSARLPTSHQQTVYGLAVSKMRIRSAEDTPWRECRNIDKVPLRTNWLFRGMDPESTTGQKGGLLNG